MNSTKSIIKLLPQISFKYSNSYNLYSLYRWQSTNREKLASSQYCMNNVKNYDYENFLCTLLLKGTSLKSALAIRAFNVEISRISSIVSDDKIGQMRLKFWEESIDKIYDTNNQHIPENPVVIEIKKAVDIHNLTKRYFQRLISCRNRPSNQGFITIKQLEEYTEQSVSSIYYLLYETNGIKNVHADHAASHLGKAQGIVNLLRSISRMERSNFIPIPQEILMKHGVSQERILRDKEGDKGVEECIFEVAGLAHQHLEKSRSLFTSVPNDAKIFLLPAIAVSRYLERLRKVNFHISNKNLQIRDTMLPFAYYFNKLRGKY